MTVFSKLHYHLVPCVTTLIETKVGWLVGVWRYFWHRKGHIMPVKGIYNLL